MTTPVLLIQGTHGWGRTDQSQQWWDRRSPFCAFLEQNGVTVLGGARPYLWDTDVDGLGWLKRRPHKKHINWEAAGWHLYDYLWPSMSRDGFKVEEYVPLKERNLIGHSHAMQVITYACSQGLVINRLLTIGSPVRQDMSEVYKAARPNIRRWLHVHSDGSDRIQCFGTLFDGHIGIVRRQSFADINLLVPKVSHSKLLNDPKCFDLWKQNGLIDFLHGANDAA